MIEVTWEKIYENLKDWSTIDPAEAKALVDFLDNNGITDDTTKKELLWENNTEANEAKKNFIAEINNNKTEFLTAIENGLADWKSVADLQDYYKIVNMLGDNAQWWQWSGKFDLQNNENLDKDAKLVKPTDLETPEAPAPEAPVVPETQSVSESSDYAEWEIEELRTAIKAELESLKESAISQNFENVRSGFLDDSDPQKLDLQKVNDVFNATEDPDWSLKKQYDAVYDMLAQDPTNQQAEEIIFANMESEINTLNITHTIWGETKTLKDWWFKPDNITTVEALWKKVFIVEFKTTVSWQEEKRNGMWYFGPDGANSEDLANMQSAVSSNPNFAELLKSSDSPEDATQIIEQEMQRIQQELTTQANDPNTTPEQRAQINQLTTAFGGKLSDIVSNISEFLKWSGILELAGLLRWNGTLEKRMDAFEKEAGATKYGVWWTDFTIFEKNWVCNLRIKEYEYIALDFKGNVAEYSDWTNNYTITRTWEWADTVFTAESEIIPADSEDANAPTETTPTTEETPAADPETAQTPNWTTWIENITSISTETEITLTTWVTAKLNYLDLDWDWIKSDLIINWLPVPFKADNTWTFYSPDWAKSYTFTKNGDKLTWTETTLADKVDLIQDANKIDKDWTDPLEEKIKNSVLMWAVYNDEVKTLIWKIEDPVAKTELQTALKDFVGKVNSDTSITWEWLEKALTALDTALKLTWSTRLASIKDSVSWASELTSFKEKIWTFKTWANSRFKTAE